MHSGRTEYFVMELPVTADGQGPVTDGTHDKILWEVWNSDFITISTFDTKADAALAAKALNEHVARPALALRGA